MTLEVAHTHKFESALLQIQQLVHTKEYARLFYSEQHGLQMKSEF